MADEKLVILKQMVENHKTNSLKSRLRAIEKDDKSMQWFFLGEVETLDRILNLIDKMLEI